MSILRIYPENLPESLEFDIVLSEIAEYCSGKMAQEEALRIVPSSEAEEVSRRLLQVNEILALFSKKIPLPPLTDIDLRPPVRRLELKNSVLEERDFLDIMAVAECYNGLYRFLEKNADRLPENRLLFEGTPPERDIPRGIEKVVDPHGNVKSSASPALARIRQELAQKRQSADRSFYRSLQKYRKKDLLGDIGETVMNSRRVLAVLSTFKKQVNGILHGSSARNSLVFVEPAECIALNGEVQLLEEEEFREIRRVLASLTRYLRPFRQLLDNYGNIIAQADLIRAKAHYALDENACMPELSKETVIEMKHAFNPVLRLFNKKKGKETVPLELSLDKKRRILVISGPNAGGKSIALKTAGLLQMMLQSGILIPVDPSSRLGIFSSLSGDIGDSQSIENELSTYSSRLEKMKYILRERRPDHFFIIDEFGSGSDPQLGSALAEVFLLRLREGGGPGILTTHYNSIKKLAAELPGVENGNMRFDRKSLSPEYRLQTGQPGSSYTFEVAARCGIPEDILEEARQRVKTDVLDMDELLSELHEREREIEQKEDRLRERSSEIESLRTKRSQAAEELKAKREKQREKNRLHEREMMWGRRFEKLLESWIKAGSHKSRQKVMERFVKMLNTQAAEMQEGNERQEKIAAKREKLRRKKVPAEKIEKGDKVRLLHTKQSGTVTDVRKDKYHIRFGNVTTIVERDKLVKL